MNRNLFTFHAWMGQRWGWWSAIPITLFWTILWPVGLIWLVVTVTNLYAHRDTSPEAVVKRRSAWADMARGNNTSHKQLTITNLGVVCWSLCALPLIAQGLVPIILRLAGANVKALFVAFYLPKTYQWPFMLAMVALGIAMLGIAIKNTRSRPQTN